MTRQVSSAAKRPLMIAAMLVSSLMLSSCSELVKNIKEMKEDDRQSRGAQLMRIADTTRQGGDLNSALALYVRAGRALPESPLPFIAVGETSYALGLFDQSAKAFDDAVILKPDNAESRSGYGKTLIALGLADEAIIQYKAAIGLAPGQYKAYAGIGVAYDMLGQHANAQALYRKGLEVAPNKLSLANNLALSLSIEGQYDAALAVLAPYQDDPRAGPLLRQNLALIYGLAGQPDKAAALASRDLNEEDVTNNLAFYERLRGLTQQDRVNAIFGPVKTRSK